MLKRRGNEETKMFNTRPLLSMTVGEKYLLLWVQAHGPVVSQVIQLFVKKHFDELSNNKGKCCFPFRDCENACKGALVQCPQRFFPAFDATNSVHTGTLICQGHITLADKDERICKMDTYISPTKVGAG